MTRLRVSRFFQVGLRCALWVCFSTLGLGSPGQEQTAQIHQAPAKLSSVMAGSNSWGRGDPRQYPAHSRFVHLNCRVSYHFGGYSDEITRLLGYPVAGPWGVVQVSEYYDRGRYVNSLEAGRALGYRAWYGESPLGVIEIKRYDNDIWSTEFYYSICQKVTSTADGTTFILAGVITHGTWEMLLPLGHLAPQLSFPAEIKGEEMYITGLHPHYDYGDSKVEIFPPNQKGVPGAKGKPHKLTFRIIAECRAGDKCPSPDGKQGDFHDLP